MSKVASLSFEIFPPNTQVSHERLYRTLDQLRDLDPDFISVTCSNRHLSIEETTLKLAGYVEESLGVKSVAHIPGNYLTKEQVYRLIDQLRRVGVSEILALRGDPLPGRTQQEDFHYAADLVAFIREIAPEMTITGACYPEVHPEAPSRVADIQQLKRKVDAGSDRLITQLFFDNEIFYRFQEHCDLAGIEVPILAGVMPIINRQQALRLIQTSSASLPRKFLTILDKYEHNPEALRAAGIAYAIDQIVDLVSQGAAGVHLYTMNQAETACLISQATASLFEATPVH